MNTRKEDIAWAAGLFEGEGCIFYNPKAHTRRLTVVNTDKEVMDKFYKIVNIGVIRIWQPKDNIRKLQYIWNIENREGIIEVLELFLKHLSSRRKEKASELLNSYKFPLGGVPHGTYSRYKNQKCRCLLCKEAHKIYTKDYVKRKLKENPNYFKDYHKKYHKEKRGGYKP